MEKEFVPYELALALQELGFDGSCFKTMLDFDITYESNVKMPLYQQVFTWFREKHNLCAWVYQSNVGSYHYSILESGRWMKGHSASVTYTSYEEAQNECVHKLIKLLKNQIV